MKGLKYLVLLLVASLVLPLSVFAEEEAKKSEVNVYFFRGETCPHCQEAEEWFKAIESEYGDKFELVDYEVWNDEDNADLMQKVAEAREETDQATGVPYIIVGDKSWIGFAEDYQDEIKEQIDKVFEQADSDRYDIMALIGNKVKKKEAKKSSGDAGALIIILLACGAIGFGVYKARSSAK